MHDRRPPLPIISVSIVVRVLHGMDVDIGQPIIPKPIEVGVEIVVLCLTLLQEAGAVREVVFSPVALLGRPLSELPFQHGLGMLGGGLVARRPLLSLLPRALGRLALRSFGRGLRDGRHRR